MRTALVQNCSDETFKVSNGKMFTYSIEAKEMNGFFSLITLKTPNKTCISATINGRVPEGC